jgi:hypothetical protein
VKSCRCTRADRPALTPLPDRHIPDEEPRDGNATLVEFTLTPVGNGTRLRVVESGFRDLAIPEENQLAAANDNTGGWISKLAEFRDDAEWTAA